MEQLSPDGHALSELFIEVFRLNGALLAAGDDITKPVGLTSSRWQVLGVVDHGAATVAQVARTMGLARQSVQQTADALAANGLIRFETNPQHRRSKLMAITTAGRTALNYVEQRQSGWANRLAEQLTPAHVAQATETVRELATLIASQANRTEDDHGE